MTSSFAALLASKKQELSSRNRAKTAKIPDGTSRWRILPSWRGEGADQFWHDFGAHYIKKPGVGGAAPTMAAVYVCVDRTYNRPCELCDAIAHAAKGVTDDATLALMNDAKAAPRVLLNAIQLDAPGAKSTEVVILEVPPSVFGQIIDIAAEWIAEQVNIIDIAGGKDLVITRTGAGKQTKYSVQVGAKSTTIDPGVRSRLHNLDEYVSQEAADQQLRAINAVRSVVGMLPAPTAGGTMPAGSVIVDDDQYAVATPPSRRAAATQEVTDVAPTPATTRVAPAPAPAAAVVESSGDADLDELLNGLG